MKIRYTYNIDVDMPYDKLDDCIFEFKKFVEEHDLQESILALICNRDLYPDIECTAIEDIS